MKIISLFYLLNAKIQEYGFLYCLKKGHPYFLRYVVIFYKNLIFHIKYPIRKLIILFRERSILNDFDHQTKSSHTLYAFYDFAVAPATFDIVTFLVLAEIARKNDCCDRIHLIIVPGHDSGFRTGDLERYNERSWNNTKYDYDYLKWRLDNIVIPCCSLLPTCTDISVFSTREEALKFERTFAGKKFPNNYSVYYPDSIIPNDGYHHVKFLFELIRQKNEMPNLKAPKYGIDIVSTWIRQHCGQRKLITITLRESPYTKERNSNLKEWVRFIRSLDEKIYFPVIIRDSEEAMNPLPTELVGLTIFPEAPFNVHLRAAVYQLSYLCLSVSNGPGVIYVYNSKIPYLIFVPSKSEQINLILRNEFPPGSQPIICSAFQRWVMEDDTFDNISREFNQLCEDIENSRCK
ncbi:hypothetical protein [Methanospirillum sp.]